MNGWEEKPEGWQFINYSNYNNLRKLENIYIDYDYDAIFVLAGGIKKNGMVHKWVERRLDVAYQLHKSSKKIVICLGGGSYHIPPITNNNNYVIHESTSCSEYLINLGMDPKYIYKEWFSYDTIANALFAFTNFIIPMKLRKIIIITSEFHMSRSKTLFQWINNSYNNICNIKFISVTDEDIDDNIIKQRIERERNSLNSLLKNVITKYTKLEDIHRWFFTEHKAYCSNSELIRENVITESEKSSY